MGTGHGRDRRHDADPFEAVERAIGLGQRVSLEEEATVALDQAMDERFAPSQDHDDVASSRATRRDPLDRQEAPWGDGGEHARPERAESERAVPCLEQATEPVGGLRATGRQLVEELHLQLSATEGWHHDSGPSTV